MSRSQAQRAQGWDSQPKPQRESQRESQRGYVVAERERLVGDGSPRAAPMQRTAEIPQRHAPHSIATLRKRLALALTPWLLTWLPELPPRRSPPQSPGSTTPLPDWTGR